MRLRARFRSEITAGVIASLLMASANTLGAQNRNAFEFGAGVLTTTGFLQRDASSGPFVRFGLVRLDAQGIPKYRSDLEVFALRKYPPTKPDGMPQRRLKSLGASLNRLVSITKSSTAPYVMFGGVVQAVAEENSHDAAAGIVGGVRGGVGYRRKFSTVTLAIEASFQLGVFALPNGLHNTRDGSVLPVTVSVRF